VSLVDEINARFRQPAIDVDEGFGAMAVAAVAARKRGLARRVEARTWINRARKRGITVRAYPAAGDDEIDAMNELFRASGNDPVFLKVG
jgi:hypothetical protein